MVVGGRDSVPIPRSLRPLHQTESDPPIVANSPRLADVKSCGFGTPLMYGESWRVCGLKIRILLSNALAEKTPRTLLGRFIGMRASTAKVAKSTTVRMLASVPATKARNLDKVVDDVSATTETPRQPRLAAIFGIVAMTVLELRSTRERVLSPKLETTARIGEPGAVVSRKQAAE